VSDLTYPFDWEQHAADQLARQEQEALANKARLERDETPRHPLDTRLVPIEFAEERRGSYRQDYVGLFWSPDIERSDMVLYLQQFWNTRSVLWEGRVIVDLGIDGAPFDPGDWMVLWDGRDLGGYPLSAAEFANRFVRKEE
jgi:hypothetical protein